MAISRLTVAVLGRLDAEGCIAEVSIVAGSATPSIRRFREVEVNLLCRMPGDDLWSSGGRQVAEEMIRITGRRWSTEYKELALEGLIRACSGTSVCAVGSQRKRCACAGCGSGQQRRCR